ncbi:GNAT family N-acetyltransferase [Paenibacillus sp.]|jgi:ribosomal protein S18 acetylase RimI-like enzyme|uniref:GNAT family N-acetyltransferase n=1 Tax=Paenibacillus sp. TaxID=58172 RepID=UPI00281C0A82|nr:GNAT family N-acetyltransferase [Paenibacillus sp.]MDR0271384.1 GNAT family N-acetyltransferase [Paenibacillus sp.]
MTIDYYKPERDQADIRTMLRGEEYFNERFQENEANTHDGIFVARYSGLTVGFLSLNNYKRGRGAGTTIFVSTEYRRLGVGTKLIEKADQLLSQYNVVERSMGACLDGDRSSLQFLYKNGYYTDYSMYFMEREGEPFTESNFAIRQYEDDDYLTWHSISQIAFYKMREQVGILPSFYYTSSESERKSFLENKNNRFVMLVDSEIVAIGSIAFNEVHHVAVRTDLQSRGYGRAIVSFLVNEIMRRGEKTVKLGVVKGNPAKNLYDRLGFKEKSLYHFVNRYYRPDTRLSGPPSDIYHKMTHSNGER